MTEEDAFLAAIVAEPDDNTRRLAYADWREDREGGPDIDLLRAQFALQGVSHDDPRYADLEHKEQAMLKSESIRKKAAEVLGAFWGLVLVSEKYRRNTASPMYARFERGVVMAAGMAPQQFKDHGKDIMARTPLRGLDLRLQPDVHYSEGPVKFLALQKNLGSVRRLRVSRGNYMCAIEEGQMTTDLTPAQAMSLIRQTAGVLRARFLPSLHALDVSSHFSDIGDIAGLGKYAEMTEVSASFAAFSPEIMRLMRALRAKTAIGLRNFLPGEGGDAAELANALCRLRIEAALQKLSLRGNTYLNSAHILELGRARVLRGIRELDLFRTNVTEAAVRAVALSSDQFPALEHVHIAGEPSSETIGRLRIHRHPPLADVPQIAAEL